MPARILDGRSVAARILEETRVDIERHRGGQERPPTLAAVLVGDDPASRVYVGKKIETCARIGIESRLETLPETTSEADLTRLLERLNTDPTVDGILLQLPLPSGLRAPVLLETLRPSKDVDGLHPVNLGKLVAEDPSGFAPCTPAGIVELLERYEIGVEGRRVVVLGRSVLVGKPVALLLLQRRKNANATVTVAHTRSVQVQELTRTADVLIVAAGRPRLVDGNWVKPGATVIDVGIHREVRDGKKRLVGDVDRESVQEVAGALTPVPGGVGPMTVAMLMRNTMIAWRRHLDE